MTTPDLPRHCALLVEDNPGDARLLQEMLGEADDARFDITAAATTLAAALARLDQGGIDLVLLDLSLPDSQGLPTFRAIQARAPGLPIIVLSGLDDEEMALKTVHAGAQDYLVKGRVDAGLLARSMRYSLERARAERALSQERNLLRSVIDNLPDPIYVKDAQGRYILDNLAHLHFIGAPNADAVTGRTVFDFFPREIAEKFNADDQAITDSGRAIVNKEEPATDSAEGRKWLLTTKVPLKDDQAKVWGLVCIGRDITEQKLAEEELLRVNADLARSQEELLTTLADLKRAHGELRDVQLQLIEAEKMKSIGRLAAGVAHEVKNPLATITMGIDYLNTVPAGEDTAVPDVLRDMADAVHRADCVIRGLLDFSAPKRLEVEPHDLNQIIRQSLLLVRGEMSGPGIEVICHLADDLPQLGLDRIKIGQVFINLFTNACHAMPEGGTLTVRTRAAQLTGVGPNIGDARCENFRAGDTLVFAEIDDTGHGIPPDKLGKVFEPFFTTKPTGKGTGLGLTVTKTIIDLHGGTISLTGRETGGTRATVVFKA